MTASERNVTAPKVAAVTGRAEQPRGSQQGPPHHAATARDVARADQPRLAQRHRTARAYRDGQLVCARVELIVRPDTRIGLAPHERRHLAARFLDRPHPTLRTELIRLARRRGAAADRVADTLEAIELVLDDPQHGPERIIGRLQPPQLRHGQLRDIEFGLRDLAPTR